MKFYVEIITILHLNYLISVCCFSLNSTLPLDQNSLEWKFVGGTHQRDRPKLYSLLIVGLKSANTFIARTSILYVCTP